MEKTVFFPMKHGDKYIPILGTLTDTISEDEFTGYVSHEFVFYPVHHDYGELVDMKPVTLTKHEANNVATFDLFKIGRKILVMNALLYAGRDPHVSVGARKLEKIIDRYLSNDEEYNEDDYYDD